MLHEPAQSAQHYTSHRCDAPRFVVQMPRRTFADRIVTSRTDIGRNGWPDRFAVGEHGLDDFDIEIGELDDGDLTIELA
jgi:hypothetical protein